MIVLDTDVLTFYFRDHPIVVKRVADAKEVVVISVISHIETLRGRFDTLLKAADGTELHRAQMRLDQAIHDLARFRIVPIDRKLG